jgi:hypothetical protein
MLYHYDAIVATTVVNGYERNELQRRRSRTSFSSLLFLFSFQIANTMLLKRAAYLEPRYLTMQSRANKLKPLSGQTTTLEIQTQCEVPTLTERLLSRQQTSTFLCHAARLFSRALSSTGSMDSRLIMSSTAKQQKDLETHSRSRHIGDIKIGKIDPSDHHLQPLYIRPEMATER